MALFVHRLSAGRRGSETADRQPASHLPAARRGAVQPRLAHARTQTHLPAAPQPGLLLFPSRIHGVPGRHDRRPTAGRPAPEPPAERSAGGPHALPRGRRHGPPDQHQTRPCGYAAPAGRDRHRPAAAENPPPGPVPRPDAPARAALHRRRPEPDADRPQQTGDLPLRQPERHAARLAARLRHARRGDRRPVRLPAGGGPGDRRHLEIEQLHRPGRHLPGQQQQPLPRRRGPLREARTAPTNGRRATRTPGDAPRGSTPTNWG